VKTCVAVQRCAPVSVGELHKHFTGRHRPCGAPRTTFCQTQCKCTRPIDKEAGRSTDLITFWKFHRLTGVNWKIFGNVPVLGTFLRSLETPFGGAVHKADETHKVLRSALPFMVCDFQFLSNSHRTYDQKTRWCCAGVGDPHRRCSLV